MSGSEAFRLEPAKRAKLIDEVTQSNWQTWPYLRASFLNMESVLPVVRVPRSVPSDSSASNTVLPFMEADNDSRLHLEQLKLPSWVGCRNLMEYLKSVNTDAFLVVHKRRLICEQYFGEQSRTRPHLTQSITKSLCALTAACCLDVPGRKDEQLTTTLLPELVGSGYAGATLRDLLDMTCATEFSEEYADPGAPSGGNDMTGLCIAMQWHPSEADGGPQKIRPFLQGLKKLPEKRHGKHFAYQSSTSECLCWAIEAAVGGRAPGRQFEELLSALVWSKLGQEQDATITVDAEGVCGVSGGLSCIPRDLARVGQMLVDGGTNMAGEQVVPKSFLEDCLAPDASSYARYSSGDPYGQAYRNNFWIFGKDPSDASFMAYGIHGQVLWAHPKEDLVVVKLATSQYPMDDFEYSAVMEALLSVRRHISKNVDTVRRTGNSQRASHQSP